MKGRKKEALAKNLSVVNEICPEVPWKACSFWQCLASAVGCVRNTRHLQSFWPRFCFLLVMHQYNRMKCQLCQRRDSVACILQSLVCTPPSQYTTLNNRTLRALWSRRGHRFSNQSNGNTFSVGPSGEARSQVPFTCITAQTNPVSLHKLGLYS